ncbi:MAG: DUF1338 domain-containing protein [Bacteroidetes bacterium]|nr:DUF1338 domain-containing protein [Bacteroidota bacterium]
MEKAKEIFDKLWNSYIELNPEVKRVYDLFKNEGETVVNDHIAFRTFEDPRVNIDVLAQPFLDAGYEYRGEYNFEQKKLYARHFEYVEFREAPRIFISQLEVHKFSEFLQTTVYSILDKIPSPLLQSVDLVDSGASWGVPSYEIYNRLREESEYAAWVYVFGFRANHFTVSINNLEKYNTIQKVNQFLKDNDFILNDSAGEIKGSPKELLEQSSIKSGIVDIDFAEGTFPVPSCYYEFAMRYPDKDGKLYLGFIAKSADKIFESTDYYEKRSSKNK